MPKLIAIIMLIFCCGTALAGLDITIDGNFDDWEDLPILVEDPKDVQQPNGDYKSIKVVAFDGVFYAMETVYGEAAPADNQRYYYHLIIDTDNDLKTGFSNREYEGNDTGVKEPN